MVFQRDGKFLFLKGKKNQNKRIACYTCFSTSSFRTEVNLLVDIVLYLKLPFPLRNFHWIYLHMSGTILSMDKIFFWKKKETNAGGAILHDRSKAMLQSKLNMGLPLIPALWFMYLFSWQYLCSYSTLYCQELMLHYVRLSKHKAQPHAAQFSLADILSSWICHSYFCYQN